MGQLFSTNPSMTPLSILQYFTFSLTKLCLPCITSILLPSGILFPLDWLCQLVIWFQEVLYYSIIHVLYGNKNYLNDSQTKNIVKKSGVIPYLNPRSWDIAEILLPHQRSCHFQKRFKLKNF